MDNINIFLQNNIVFSKLFNQQLLFTIVFELNEL